jgi:hypothetical protein
MSPFGRRQIPSYLEVMDNPADERRRARRYPMEVAVSLGDLEGRTRDLSSRGVYLLTPLQPAVGTFLDIAVTLPPSSPMGNLPLSLRARVVRRDDLGDEQGIAAEIVAWEVAGEP